jgi:hypothetical protein
MNKAELKRRLNYLFNCVKANIVWYQKETTIFHTHVLQDSMEIEKQLKDMLDGFEAEDKEKIDEDRTTSFVKKNKSELTKKIYELLRSIRTDSKLFGKYAYERVKVCIVQEHLGLLEKQAKCILDSLNAEDLNSEEKCENCFSISETIVEQISGNKLCKLCFNCFKYSANEYGVYAQINYVGNSIISRIKDLSKFLRNVHGKSDER